MDLICPKCQGAMRQYERNGITIDQCTECRGVFLDRGELERLVEAENRWYAQQGGGGHQPPPPPPPRQPRSEPYYEDRGYRGGHGGGYHYHKRKKKRSFMDDIFDF